MLALALALARFQFYPMATLKYALHACTPSVGLSSACRPSHSDALATLGALHHRRTRVGGVRCRVTVPAREPFGPPLGQLYRTPSILSPTLRQH